MQQETPEESRSRDARLPVWLVCLLGSALLQGGLVGYVSTRVFPEPTEPERDERIATLDARFEATFEPETQLFPNREAEWIDAGDYYVRTEMSPVHVPPTPKGAPHEHAKPVDSNTILDSIGRPSGPPTDALSDGPNRESIDEAFGDAESISGIGPLLPTQPPVEVALADIATAGVGRLDKETISETVDRRIDRIEACYARKLENHPGIEGLVIVNMTVGSAGRVTQAKPTEDTVGNGVGTCAADVVEETRFPKPGGGEVVANLTFNFAPDKGEPTAEEGDR